MALIEINRNPSRRDLLVFGILFLVFTGLLGAAAQWRWHAPLVARIIWTAGAAVTALFFGVPAARRPIYLAWVTVTMPIGFVVSYLVLIVTFLVVIMPVGLIMRLFGKDPMSRKFDPKQRSYWFPHRSDQAPEQYFRQY